MTIMVVARGIMEHHSGALMGLCLLSVMSVKLLPLMPCPPRPGETLP